MYAGSLNERCHYCPEAAVIFAETDPVVCPAMRRTACDAHRSRAKRDVQKYERLALAPQSITYKHDPRIRVFS
jgi:hypothetical protein